MTPALKKIKKAGIPFQTHEYAHDPGVRAYGREASDKLGLDPDLVFKTLVVEVQGQGPALALVPVSGQLDLKAFARAAGGKKAAMADKSLAERITGYLAGGISPIGQKKALPTIIDASARHHAQVYVSGGRRGLQISLSPQDLGALTQASFHPVSRPL